MRTYIFTLILKQYFAILISISLLLSCSHTHAGMGVYLAMPGSSEAVWLKIHDQEKEKLPWIFELLYKTARLRKELYKAAIYIRRTKNEDDYICNHKIIGRHLATILGSEFYGLGYKMYRITEQYGGPECTEIISDIDHFFDISEFSNNEEMIYHLEYQVYRLQVFEQKKLNELLSQGQKKGDELSSFETAYKLIINKLSEKEFLACSYHSLLKERFYVDSFQELCEYFKYTIQKKDLHKPVQKEMEYIFPEIVKIADSVVYQRQSHKKPSDNWQDELEKARKIIEEVTSTDKYQKFILEIDPNSDGIPMKPRLSIKESLMKEERALSESVKKDVFSAALLILMYFQDKLQEELNQTEPKKYMEEMEKIRWVKEFLDKESITEKDKKVLLALYICSILGGSDAATGGSKFSILQWIPFFSKLVKVNICDDTDKEFIFDLFTKVKDQHDPHLGASLARILYQQAAEILASYFSTNDTAKMVDIITTIHYKVNQKKILTEREQFRYELREIMCVTQGLCDVDCKNVNTGVIEKRFLSRKLIIAYVQLCSWLKKQGYDTAKMADGYAGADVSTALYLTDAEVLIFNDALPFDFDAQLEDFELLKNYYMRDKLCHGYSQSELLWTIGNAKIPLWWELKALNAENIRFEKNPTDPKSFYIHFDWSYSGLKKDLKKRTIMYTQKELSQGKDKKKAKKQPEVDIYLFKAGLKQLPTATAYPVIISFDTIEVPAGYSQIPIAEIVILPEDTTLTLFDNKKNTYGSIRDATILIKESEKVSNISDERKTSQKLKKSN